MEFNFDDNIIWILVILALVFFLFPQKNANVVPDKEDKKEEADYIYRRKPKERKRLDY